MRALTIRQPFALLIIAGIKPVENRNWSTNYRGPLLIHAASKLHDIPIAEIEAKHGIEINRDRMQFSGIIGRVELIDVVTAHPSRWFDGPFGFVLSQPRAVKFMPMRGFQGFFDVPMP